MLLLVEIIMLIAGLWALAAGKLPSLLFGGPQYVLEGRGVRWLGLILILPLPIALAGGTVLTLLWGQQGTFYAFGLELLMVCVAGITALVVARAIRQPRVSADATGEIGQEAVDIEALIAKKAQGSLTYVLLGGTGVGAPIFCPLAFIRSGQALKMIEQHGIGERHRRIAEIARALSAILLVAWASIAICLLLPLATMR
jgi:hypothetical protein